MSYQGYYRYPTLFKDILVFVSEETLWSVPIEGGVARRLTAETGAIRTPVFSPDGEWIAFAACQEGCSEVYVMPSQGGPTQRLTFLGDTVQVICWQGKSIYFASSARSPFERVYGLWRVDAKGGSPEPLSLGPGNTISFPSHVSGGVSVSGRGSPCVIQRHGYREYGFWKRYRGGTAGEVWIDQEGSGEFEKLIDLKSDLSRPLWLGDRIYFASDHEGVGNLYSCTIQGTHLKRHTHHSDYYLRNPAKESAGDPRIVYHAGGDLYCFDAQKDETRQVSVNYYSNRAGRNRKFVRPDQFMQSYTLHPKGHHVGIVSRGKPFVFGNWEGPVLQLGELNGTRYRLLKWMREGTRVIVVSDFEGEDRLEIYDVKTTQCVFTSKSLDLGRITELYPNPQRDEVVLCNHRNELIHVTLPSSTMRILECSAFGPIAGVSWSPDGLWIAYGCSISLRQTAIKLANLKTGQVVQISNPVLKDIHPTFDPEGKYLYFLSYREFHPEWDSLHFALSFPCGMRPYVVMLQKDLTSPFRKESKELSVSLGDKVKGQKDQEDEKEKHSQKEKVTPLKIDLPGIQDRIQAFPVEPGLYGQIAGLKGKVLLLSWPLLSPEEDSSGESTGGVLEVFDFDSQKVEEVAHDLHDFDVSMEGETLLGRFGKRLRVWKVAEKLEEKTDLEPSAKSGWIDSCRLRVSVEPVLEWEQIYKEAWRLQKDLFWVPDMSDVDWKKVFDRYYPLLQRISNRSELNDVVWEMQGELGTSHAYVIGGDIDHSPPWTLGFLAADFQYDAHHKAYRIFNIAKGDPWNPKESSPFAQPGLNIQEQDLIFAVNGREVLPDRSPEHFLVHLGGQDVCLKVGNKHGKKKRDITIKTLISPRKAWYRTWVEKNRSYVHHKTKGRVGYLHIPDMGTAGFAEFHRGFLAESDREGLIVDVRFNGGGNVSPLILEKLARRRLGYDLTRWFGAIPYPMDSPAGPMVALTNEYAGSDGDIFSHGFKLLKLGPLIGKRTWGGVIGIWPRHSLVDGGYTTQPEFSAWFFEGRWGLENYGVDPDIVVELRPQDVKMIQDPQLDRGILEILRILKERPPQKPDFSGRPRLSIPLQLEPYNP